MNTISDRIASRLNELGLKQVDLIEATGLSKGAISKWVTGTTVPSSEHISAIAEKLKVSPEWLLTGKQSNHYENSQLNQVHNSYVNGSVNQSVVHHNCIEPQIIKLDFYPQANASATKETIHLTKQILPVLADFATVVIDDMMTPALHKKSTIVCRNVQDNEPIYPNKIYVLNMHGLLVCRYMERLTSDRIRIYSENNKEGLVLSQDEFNQEYQIMGHVVWYSGIMEW